MNDQPKKPAPEAAYILSFQRAAQEKGLTTDLAEEGMADYVDMLEEWERESDAKG